MIRTIVAALMLAAVGQAQLNATASTCGKTLRASYVFSPSPRAFLPGVITSSYLYRR